MACNCTTQEQLAMLYKTYGEKVDEKLSKNSKAKFKNTLMRIGVFVCMLFITPFLILYVLYKGFGDKNKQISVKKFFNLQKVAQTSDVG